ncbi:IclR family transcriptional regulator [Flexivirga oryzae]|uniref:DNA-binding IclR family transcriptional regulator n=1 Tax=Flexivirga oryzae TaxID=1794944 RepID=A0A839NF99_9MICO|nr:IclR family transcriptional regulator [Flexivirga oryzae]MBB2893815.1 DNA-binding IclR family transcriptional regulator [Flexivirga oryzae]
MKPPPPSGTAEGTQPPYLIESIDNGSRILLMLQDRPTIRAAEVARELGVARSTAHRMVSTLVHRGMLRQNPADKSYSAGFALVKLGLAVMGAGDLKAEVQPYLDRLTAITGETAQFLVREDDEVLFVSGSESPQVVRAGVRIGTRMPAHVTASGRCLLALTSEDRLKQLYPSQRLHGGTDTAIRTRKALFDDLQQVRSDGFAVNDAASEAALISVAMPLLDSHDMAQGAISVSGPAERMRDKVEAVRTDLAAVVGDLETTLFRRSVSHPADPDGPA